MSVVITQPPGDASAKHWRRILWMAGFFGLLAAAVNIAFQVRTVTIPLLVALTIAYVLNPAVDALERRGLRRSTAIAVLMGVLLLVGSAVLAVLGPAIWEELSQVPVRLQQLLTQLRPWIEKTFKMVLPTSIDAVLTTLQQELMPAPEAGMGAWVRRAGAIANVIFGSTVSVLTSLVSTLMMPFFVVYILRHFHRLVGALQAVVPLPVRHAVLTRLREIDTTLSAFARGQLVVGTLLAVWYAIGLSVVGVPLGLVLGILTGLGNTIPFLGTAFGLMTTTLMTLVSWRGWPHLTLVYSVFALGHMLESWVITPRVVGNRVGLSPFVVIVAVLVFGELFGFFGVLVAVPVTAILKILLRVALEHYRASSFFTGSSVT